MTAPALERLIQEIEELKPSQRAELLRRLEALTPHEDPRVREIDRRLMEKGLLKSLPPPTADWDRIRDWRPAPIQGPALSELILEERR